MLRPVSRSRSTSQDTGVQKYPRHHRPAVMLRRSVWWGWGVAAADANHTNGFNIMRCVSHSCTGYISNLLLGLHFNCREIHPKTWEILRMVDDSLFSNFNLVPVSIKPFNNHGISSSLISAIPVEHCPSRFMATCCGLWPINWHPGYKTNRANC
jgi:hypothetical protein